MVVVVAAVVATVVGDSSGVSNDGTELNITFSSQSDSILAPPFSPNVMHHKFNLFSLWKCATLH